jgi:creatinine amidohydrolase
MKTEISKMSWTEFDEARKKTDMVIIPVGSVEVFGPHLPLGSDMIIAERLSQRLCEMTNAIMAPVVPVGYTLPLMDFPGTLTVKPGDLGNYLKGIADSLIGWGFRRILFFNSHRRNVPVIDEIILDYHSKKTVKCAQVFWWQMVERNAVKLMKSSIAPFGHAGEACTAVLMEVAPELVNMDAAVCTHSKSKSDYPEIFGYKRYGDMTNTGLIGDPFKASEEQGKEVVRICLDRIAGFVNSEFLS